ncbi:HNH endonuclease signature motif containing protein [Streptomyces sp. NBC_01294]|uniref:HNH endonuclease signature motif containing protein n=1 Tax=Streptomyces sp. NBC_01294 TaxID=2903815 RepID=UPI002DD9CE53|nr:HNH endonuclease signature motif containing protein [Streptomyces sp. NBC_01294]
MRRFAHHRIDVSHFAPTRGRGRPTRDELQGAVAQSCSIAETLRRLGHPDTSGRRAALRQWTTDYGIPTAHFLGQAHQRGRVGPTPVKAAAEILVKHDGKRRSGTHLLRRALREIGVPECCDMCGTPPDRLGRPMTLEVDHINGDWSDDRAENLRLLCPNCHAVTDTWCRTRHRKAVAPRTSTVVD